MLEDKQYGVEGKSVKTGVLKVWRRVSSSQWQGQLAASGAASQSSEV